MRDPGLRGLGPKDRRRALRNRANRQRYLDAHPLAPLTEREIQRQATGDLAAQYDPLVRSINQHTRAGAQNITGIADALAKSLMGQEQTQKSVYDQARQNLSKLDQSVADRLGIQATGMNSELTARLQQAGIPTDSAQAQQFAAAAQSTPGVNYASNSAEEGALNLREAAALANAAQQPGFARALGLQQLGQYRARKQQELADLNDKRLSAAGQLIQSIRGREFQKGATNLGFQGDLAGYAAAGQRTAMQQAGANARNAASNMTRAQIAAANRRAAMARAKLAEGGRNSRARAAAIKQGRKVDVPRSEATGVTYDNRGNIIRWKHGPGKGKPVPWYGKKGRLHGNARGKKAGSGGGDIWHSGG